MFLDVDDLHVVKCDMNLEVSERLSIDINLEKIVIKVCFDRLIPQQSDASYAY